jgi:trimethylamine--corrinoid protein Co-methyltransferase
VILVTDGKKFPDVLNLLNKVHGDISSKPFAIPYINPVTPLNFNEDSTDKLLLAIELGLPVCFSNYSMYGGTSPMTEGGTLALLNAELLAGLVFCQAAKEGTPTILGSLPAGFNMATMGSYYSTSSYLLNIACAEMMHFYNIPHCGTSGSGIGLGPDLLAAGGLWMNHLTSCMSKVGMAPFVGGNFDSTAFSPTTVVMSDYIIGKARKFARGFVLDENSVDLDEINEVGHGGNYLTSSHTLDAMIDFNRQNELWPLMSMESWQQKGSPSPKKLLREYTLELLDKAGETNAEVEDILKRGEEIIYGS